MAETVDVIIVNWNAGRQLRDCLGSIATAASRVPIRSVIVVDNASTDDSLEYVKGAGLPVIVIRNTENRGFAAACNSGAQQASADYLLFLNPDTILNDTSLAIPVEFLSKPDHAQYGIVGIQLYDENGEINPSCARFPTPATMLWKTLGLDRLMPTVFRSYPMTEWDHAANRDVDHVIGAFYLIRHGLFKSLGGFDERFFVYLEDLDLSLRVKQSGWKIMYLTDAKAYHKGGGTSYQVKATRLFYSLCSRLLYGFKHFTVFNASLLLLMTVAVEPWSRIFYALLQGKPKEACHTLHGYWLLLLNLPKILQVAHNNRYIDAGLHFKE